MSIRTLIADRIAEGRLMQLPHMLLGLRTPRVIYLVSDLFRELVQGPWTDEETEFQMGTLRADLDRFLEGSPIIVGYRRARHAYMKRLYPGRVKFGKLEAATQDQNIGFLVGLPKLMYLSERNAWIAII